MQLAVREAGGLAAAFDLALVIRLATSDTYRSRRRQSETESTQKDTKENEKNNLKRKKEVWLGEGQASKTLHTAAPTTETFGRLPTGSDLVVLRDVACTQSKKRKLSTAA